MQGLPRLQPLSNLGQQREPHPKTAPQDHAPPAVIVNAVTVIAWPEAMLVF